MKPQIFRNALIAASLITTSICAGGTAWLSNAEWRSGTFDSDWKEVTLGSYVKAKSSPVVYSGTIAKGAERIAFDIPDLKAKLGDFDSVVVTYRSSHELGMTAATMPADDHGFELETKTLPASESPKSVTFYPGDFAQMWGEGDSISLKECNSISFWNYSLQPAGEKISITIDAVTFF